MAAPRKGGSPLSAISNKDISAYLDKVGIRHSYQGYRYLMLCLRAILDGEVDRFCIRTVFDYVGAQCDVASGQVDRAIRKAIRSSNAPIRNKEFLLRAADDLMLSADANAFVFGAAGKPTTDQASGPPTEPA